MLSSLEEATSSLSNPHQQLVELHKERHTQSMHHVSIEQTDITIADSADGEPCKWRSIAIEGTREKILKFLETKVPSGAGGSDGERNLGELLREVGGEPRGYPQFVLDLPQVTEPGSFKGVADTEPQYCVT